MNKLITTRRFFSALVVGLAVTLAACGSGSSGTSQDSGTAFSEVGAGMNRSQIEAVLGAPVSSRDDPQPDGSTYTVLKWSYADGSTLQIILINGIIKSKVVSKNDKTVSSQVY